MWLRRATSPPPSSSSRSLTHAAVRSARPLRAIAVSGAGGRQKQRSAEFAHLSASSNVKAGARGGWGCHRNILQMCQTDRQTDGQSASCADVSCFLRRSPTTSFMLFTSFCFPSLPPFPLSLSPSLLVSVNPHHLDFTLQPLWSQRGLKIDLINIASFDRFNINA